MFFLFSRMSDHFRRNSQPKLFSLTLFYGRWTGGGVLGIEELDAVVDAARGRPLADVAREGVHAALGGRLDVGADGQRVVVHEAVEDALCRESKSFVIILRIR